MVRERVSDKVIFEERPERSGGVGGKSNEYLGEERFKKRTDVKVLRW